MPDPSPDLRPSAPLAGQPVNTGLRLPDPRRGPAPDPAPPALPDSVLALFDPKNLPPFVRVPGKFDKQLDAAIARLTTDQTVYEVHNTKWLLHAMEIKKVDDNMFVVTIRNTRTFFSPGEQEVETAVLRRSATGWEIAGASGQGAEAKPYRKERMVTTMDGTNGGANWASRFGWLSDPNDPLLTARPAMAPVTHKDFPASVIKLNTTEGRLFQPAVQPTFLDVPVLTTDGKQTGLNANLDALAARRKALGVCYLCSDHPGAKHTMMVEGTDDLLVITTYHTLNKPGARQLVDTSIFMKTNTGWRVASMDGRGCNAQPTPDETAKSNLTGLWMTRLSWLSDPRQNLTTTRPSSMEPPPPLPRP